MRIDVLGCLHSNSCHGRIWTPALCYPRDCSPPGSSVRGIHQARILEWVAIPLSRESSQPRDWAKASCTAGRSSLSCQGSPKVNRASLTNNNCFLTTPYTDPLLGCSKTSLSSLISRSFLNLSFIQEGCWLIIFSELSTVYNEYPPILRSLGWGCLHASHTLDLDSFNPFEDMFVSAQFSSIGDLRTWIDFRKVKGVCVYTCVFMCIVYQILRLSFALQSKTIHSSWCLVSYSNHGGINLYFKH